MPFTVVLLVTFFWLASCNQHISSELYRIQLLPGRDLVLKTEDNPCTELRKYCILVNTTTKNCVKKYQPKVQKEILNFPDFMGQLIVDDRLFINCEEVSLIDDYESMDFGGFYMEMLHLLQTVPPGDMQAMHAFDMRRTEVEMRGYEQITLYSRGVVLHPNSSFVISQLGLALSQEGLKGIATTLYTNAVNRRIWPSIMQRPEWNYYPGFISKPWHDSRDFSFTSTLKAGYSIIRSELLSNLKRDQISMSDDISNKAAVFEEKKWRVLYLKHPNAENYTEYINTFPQTYKILKDCNVSFIEVKFSALQPGTHIKPHTGPSNSRLRIHLGLVHTGGARIRVGTEWRTWTEGSVFIFDSSWEHEVMHSGPDVRTVLILDIHNS